MYRSNFAPFLICHRNDIGDVVFTLHVVVGQFGQPALQVCAVGNQDAGVDFLDLTLLVSGILMFNNACDFTVITRNSPITRWVVQFNR